MIRIPDTILSYNTFQPFLSYRHRHWQNRIHHRQSVHHFGRFVPVNPLGRDCFRCHPSASGSRVRRRGLLQGGCKVDSERSCSCWGCKFNHQGRCKLDNPGECRHSDLAWRQGLWSNQGLPRPFERVWPGECGETPSHPVPEIFQWGSLMLLILEILQGMSNIFVDIPCKILERND